MDSISTSTNIFLFWVIIIFSLVVIFLSNNFLISESLYYNTFAEQLTAEKIEEAFFVPSESPFSGTLRL
jgi:hypothetical protein